MWCFSEIMRLITSISFCCCFCIANPLMHPLQLSGPVSYCNLCCFIFVSCPQYTLAFLMSLFSISSIFQLSSNAAPSAACFAAVNTTQPCVDMRVV